MYKVILCITVYITKVSGISRNVIHTHMHPQSLPMISLTTKIVQFNTPSSTKKSLKYV